MDVRRHAPTVLVASLLVLGLASCGVGETKAADQVTDVGARLNGAVVNTVTGTTSWYFEYGETTSYGSTTATQSLSVGSTDASYPVSASISGLDEASTYHYRLCAHDVDGHGVCGADQTVATTTGYDSVTGRGRLPQIVNPIFEVGGFADARSLPDGSSPSGFAGSSPGSIAPQFTDGGAVTCLRVDGNRAAIGYVAHDPVFDPGGEFTVPRVVFVEDNGPTGDRWGATTEAAPVTTCPVPTDDDFLAFPIAVGDFVVHDHP